MAIINLATVQAALVKTRQAIRESINAVGDDCDFVLRSTEEFTIKGTFKHQAEIALTDGMNQDRRRLSVAAEDWVAVAPADRDPEKGDQVTVDGRRHAIMEADPVSMGGMRFYWRLKLTG